MPTSVRIEGNFKLIVDIPTRCATTASAVMFLKREDGSEQELWHRPLPNNPDWWRLDGKSGWFVALGNACSYALAHALIVYDSAGRIVADRSVADLFTPEERRMMGWTVLGDTPRDLADDERSGSDIFSASKVVFEDDGVWLTHNRVERKVLLTRR